MQGLYDRGHIYEGVYEGWYCPNCADFKTEQELLDGNRCPIHKIVLEKVREENYFFRLSAFQERLEQLYAERPEWVLPRIRYNEALSFIKGGLEDVSVSRPKLQWGVRVPWDESQVFYVWFDALLNYYTALQYGLGEDVSDRFWPPALHLIGKDILKFHAVIWPAMLMADEVELPRRLFIHGYLLMQGEKMSKTLGNVLDPFQVIDVYGVDALRYYCFREVSFGAGRLGLDRGLRGPLQHRARERVRQPRQPDARDDRALPRRRRAGGRAAGRSSPPTSTACPAPCGTTSTAPS